MTGIVLAAAAAALVGPCAPSPCVAVPAPAIIRARSISALPTHVLHAQWRHLWYAGAEQIAPRPRLVFLRKGLVVRTDTGGRDWLERYDPRLLQLAMLGIIPLPAAPVYQLLATTNYSSPGSGTFNRPAGVVDLIVRGVGGGGGGGGSGGGTNGGGGGGGGYADRAYLSASASYGHVVGAGGSSGSAGAHTTFNATMTAAGGTDGSDSNGGTGGVGGGGASGDNSATGGTGGTGDLVYGGGGGGGGAAWVTNGGNGGNASGGVGGDGGAGVLGNPGGSGGNGGTGANTNAGPGLAGFVYGGGGGGAAGNPAGYASGGNGYLRIEQYGYV